MTGFVDHLSPRKNFSSVDTLVVNNVPVKTSIHKSVLKCDADNLKTQLYANATQINAGDSFGNTALHYAAISGDERCLKILLKHPKVDVNIRNHANRTALHWALDKSNVKVITTLICQPNIHLDNEKDWEGRTYRQILIQKHPELATKLLGLKPRQVLKALSEKQLDQFTKVLHQQEDLTHYFYTVERGTLLDIACRSPGNGKFVEILLAQGVRINTINPKTKIAAIHEAILNSDAETVKILIQDDECDVNVMDKLGNSALHYAVLRNDVEIMRILLQSDTFGNPLQPKLRQNHQTIVISDKATPNTNRFIDINAINQLNQTPLHVALLEKKHHAIAILLDQPNIDLDVQKDLNGLTCRQIISESFPQFLRQATPTLDSLENLFSLLHKRDVITFIERIQLAQPSSTITNGKYTYLQYACKYGMVNVVRALLTAGINPNAFSPVKKLTPMMLASYEGYHEILSLLLNHPGISFEPIESVTILHGVMEGMLKARDLQNTLSDANRNHYQCLQYILERVIKNGIMDINFGDKNGNTALHMAVALDDYQVLKDLLDQGAYLGQKNDSDVEPVRVMNPDTLRQYLDSCVTSKGQLMRDNYQIIFAYKSLIPPTRASVSEIETLYIMTEDVGLRRLLQHPILRSYLDLKWQALKMYTHANLAFYATFWLTLNLYFYYYFTCVLHQHNTNQCNTQFVKGCILGPLSIAVCILCSILALREIYQYLLSPRLYRRSLINLLEWILIVLVLAFVIICANIEINYVVGKMLAGVAIIISSVELISLMGRLPMFSNCLPMVRAVAANCLKFFFWYLILLLGVALGLKIIDSNPGQPEWDIPLDERATFIYNITKMSLGIIRAPDVANDQSLNLYSILFLSVVFLNMIVNGLALVVVAEVTNSSELFGIISRVKSIYRAESMANEDAYGVFQATDNFFKFLRECGQSVITGQMERQQMFYRRLRLADYIGLKYQIAIERNRGNVVRLPAPDSASYQGTKTNVFDRGNLWIVDPSVVASAANILEKRNANNEALSRNDFERMEKSIQNLTTILESKLK